MKIPMGTRIKDIAEQAGVSLATVSLVLNNKPGVGPETREQILALATQLGYTKRGRQHRTGKPPSGEGTVQFVKIARHGHTVNRDHTVFIADYIDGLTHGARSHNYRIEISSFDGSPIQEIIATLQGVPELVGIVVLGTELSRDDVLAFSEIDLPLVFLDTFIDYLPFDFIDMNNRDSVYRVVQYFVENGHTEIGMVRSSVQTRNFELRHEAFLQAMRVLECPIRDDFVFDCDSTFDGAYRDMHKALESASTLPTALFCTNDIIAFGVMKALRERGIRVPEDISVIGFDDLPTSALMEPSLTSIAVSKWEIGNTAIAQLTYRIEHPQMPAVKIVVGGTLVERRSVRRITYPSQP